MAFFHFPSLNLLYQSIPRNACTTTKRSILSHLQIIDSLDNPGGQVHQICDQFRIDRESAFELLKNNNNYKLLAILRNPISRYISVYLDKFCVSFENPEPFVSEFPIGWDISFVDFLGYIASVGPDRLDEHWRPQPEFLSGLEKSSILPRSIDTLRWSKTIAVPGHKLKILSVDHHSTAAKSSIEILPNLSIYAKASDIYENACNSGTLPSKQQFIDEIYNLEFSKSEAMRSWIESEANLVNDYFR